MLDWKLLAAGFVALMFVSSAFVGNFGIKDVFGDIIKQIEHLFGSSPFSGFSSKPQTERTKEITITFSPPEMSVAFDDPVDVHFDDTVFTAFTGTIDFLFDEQNIIFKPKGSQLKITVPVQHTIFDKLSFSSLTQNNSTFLIAPNISTSDGSVELTGFSGKGVVDTTSFTINGTVSTARFITDGRAWELI